VPDEAVHLDITGEIDIVYSILAEGHMHGLGYGGANAAAAGQAFECVSRFRQSGSVAYLPFEAMMTNTTPSRKRAGSSAVMRRKINSQTLLAADCVAAADAVDRQDVEAGLGEVVAVGGQVAFNSEGRVAAPESGAVGALSGRAAVG